MPQNFPSQILKGWSENLRRVWLKIGAVRGFGLVGAWQLNVMIGNVPSAGVLFASDSGALCTLFPSDCSGAPPGLRPSVVIPWKFPSPGAIGNGRFGDSVVPKLKLSANDLRLTYSLKLLVIYNI